MVKANELRVGNWVINDCDDKQMQVTAGDIYVASKDEDWLLPIHLTIQVLNKLGFTRTGSYWVMGLWEIPIMPTIDGREILMFPNNHYAAMELKHLHQLQNLFFSLTGIELNYQP